MLEKVKISIDVMGGDNSPDKTLEGINLFIKRNQNTESEIKKRFESFDKDIINWNDYDFIALLYTPLIGDPSIPERKIEGKIDQYYNVVEENHFFDTQKSGYFNPNVSILISYDYNNSFKQIYP